MPRPKRRRYLIDLKFQIPVAIVMALAGMAMLGYHMVTLRATARAVEQGAAFRDDFVVFMVPFYVAIVLSLGVLGVLISHRVVGPAYRLGLTLRALAEGDVTARAGLRRSDALKDLADDVNALAAKLEADSDARASQVARLRQLMSSKAASSDEIESVLAELEG